MKAKTSEEELGIKAGDRVRWTSTSNGSTVTKEGVFVGIIPTGVKPSDAFSFLRDMSSSQVKLGGGKHGPSTNERALIRVQRFNKTGKPITPWYYGPRLSVLEKVDI